jgi:hypothetical protein
MCRELWPGSMKRATRQFPKGDATPAIRGFALLPKMSVCAADSLIRDERLGRDWPVRLHWLEWKLRVGRNASVAQVSGSTT